jgi:hypothetical protein
MINVRISYYDGHTNITHERGFYLEAVEGESPAIDGPVEDHELADYVEQDLKEHPGLVEYDPTPEPPYETKEDIPKD